MTAAVSPTARQLHLSAVIDFEAARPGDGSTLAYTPKMCIILGMVRAQILLDEPTADRLRVVAAHSGASMSEVVRQALVFYFDHREPDTSWIGSLKPKRQVSHDLAAIRASVVSGRRTEAKR